MSEGMVFGEGGFSASHMRTPGISSLPRTISWIVHGVFDGNRCVWKFPMVHPWSQYTMWISIGYPWISSVNFMVRSTAHPRSFTGLFVPVTPWDAMFTVGLQALRGVFPCPCGMSIRYRRSIAKALEWGTPPPIEYA